MTPFNSVLDRFGRWLARHLETQTPSEAPYVPSDRQALRRTLRTGDVLLVAGSSTLSTAIKYLTQSTWSHAALYVGDMLDQPVNGDEPHVLIEVTATDGCISIPLSKYEHFHTRICRPVGLTEADREALVEFMISGPVVVQVLEGEGAVKRNRDIMGATNPANAEPGTIRKELAESIEANSVHGSDSDENAATEIAYFFKPEEIVG